MLEYLGGRYDEKIVKDSEKTLTKIKLDEKER